MKLYYRLLKDDDNRYIASFVDYNIIISGDTKEEIEIELRNAMDGYIQAFGLDSVQDIDEEIYALDYDLKGRMKR